MLVLDGGYGEGGGALVRTALAMSALTVQPFRMENVRGQQARQGLNSEDLAVLRTLAHSASAETVGAEMGATQFSFLPTRTVRPFRGDVHVPESDERDGHANALVVLTSVAPVLARAGGFSSLRVQGETFGRNVLGYDAFEGVTLPAWLRMGLFAETDLERAGFGLGSKGKVTLDIEPSALNGVKWTDRGQMLSVRALVSTAELPEAIADRGVSHLTRLAQNSGIALECEMSLLDSGTPGAHITVFAEFENGFGSGSAAGSRGVRIEAVAQQAFEGFLDWYKSDSTVDSFLADQMLLVAVVAEGESIWKVHRLTQRFLSMVWVVKQFLPIHITVKGQEGNPGTVTIRR